MHYCCRCGRQITSESVSIPYKKQNEHDTVILHAHSSCGRVFRAELKEKGGEAPPRGKRDAED